MAVTGEKGKPLPSHKCQAHANCVERPGKAALPCAHSKTWQSFESFRSARSVLERVRASAAFVLNQASRNNQKNFVPPPNFIRFFRQLFFYFHFGVTRRDQA